MYVLFLATCAGAVKKGTDRVFWVSAVLVSAVAVLDIWEAVSRGKQE